MKIKEAKKIVISQILSVLGYEMEIQDDLQLIGVGSLFDSMMLVELCLALEDCAEKHNFEFDWTSDATMSKSRSMFRTTLSLVEEFAAQSVTQL